MVLAIKKMNDFTCRAQLKDSVVAAFPSTGVGNGSFGTPIEILLCSASVLLPDRRADQQIAVCECSLIKILILLPPPYIPETT